jgi:hypothetical protein
MAIPSTKILPTSSPSSHEHLHRFKHRAVRDLAWALSSPALFLNIPDLLPEWFKQDYVDDEVWPWLSIVDKKPEPLYEHLTQQRSTRLGIYFEQFPRFTLLAKNLQVPCRTKHGQQRTLGEFDFIIEDKADNSVKHLEAAVKFYLGHNNYRGEISNNQQHYNWHNWVGPNQKDTLAIKMRHLQQHQLPLIQTIPGRETLNEINVKSEAITSRLLIKGRFYLPIDTKKKGYQKTEMPCFSNSALVKNYWLGTDALFEAPSFLDKNFHYCILPRSTWLSELTSADIEQEKIETLRNEQLISTIKDDLKQDYNEWQIAKIDFSNKDNAELERFFLVNSQNLPFDK